MLVMLFLKINTIDGRLYARLRTAIKDYQIMQNLGGNSNEEKY